MQKLPKPRFNLKTPGAQKETLIFMVYRYRGRKLLYSTGLTIHPKDWDFKIQRPVELNRRPDLWKIHRDIDHLASICKSIYMDADYGQIEVADFKKQLDQLTQKVPGPSSKESVPKERITFFEFLDQELVEMRATHMKYDTWRMFKLHAHNLKKFAKHRGTFDFDDVYWDLRLDLVDWLASRNDQVGYGAIWQ